MDKFTRWWTMHITIPFGALHLYYDDYRNEVKTHE